MKKSRSVRGSNLLQHVSDLSATVNETTPHHSDPLVGIFTLFRVSVHN